MARYGRQPDKLILWAREGISCISMEQFQVRCDSFPDHIICRAVRFSMWQNLENRVLIWYNKTLYQTLLEEDALEMSAKRKDSKKWGFPNGETQRPAGKYIFRYTNLAGYRRRRECCSGAESTFDPVSAPVKH